MAKENFLVGLDIGSSSVSGVLCSEDPCGKIAVKAVSRQDCHFGIKNGIVRDINKVSEAIMNVVDELEEKKGSGVLGEVNIAVRGEHIYSLNNSGIYNITRSDKEINSEDILNVIDNAKAIHLKDDREIIHVIPQQFSIDKQKGFPNPAGMDGSILGVDVHLVTCGVNHMNNIAKSVSHSGLTYNEMIYHLYPLCEMVLSEEEKEIGSLLVDFGDQTTSVAIYKNGKMIFSKELPVGGYNITNDISIALSVATDSAKMLKEKYGCAVSSALKDIDAEQEISVLALDRIRHKKVRPIQVKEYIQPRVEEILEKIKGLIAAEEPVNSAVITGGGALLKGMPEAASTMLEMNETRIGYLNPDMVIYSDEEFSDQKYFSAIGAAAHNFIIRNKRDIDVYPTKKTNSVKRWVSVFKELFR